MINEIKFIKIHHNGDNTYHTRRKSASKVTNDHVIIFFKLHVVNVRGDNESKNIRGNDDDNVSMLTVFKFNLISKQVIIY